MRFVGAAEIDRVLTFPTLVDALEEAFAGRWHVPVRHHHAIADGGGSGATLLLMPAWTDDAPRGGFLGTKIVTVFPGNAGTEVPTVTGAYLLNDGGTGVPLAVMDGARLTLWRTAAASALAARHLARGDAEKLVVVGAGRLAPFLARAHASQRPIKRIAVWGRDHGRAQAAADGLRAEGFAVQPAADLPGAVRDADLVSCATLSPTPVVSGEWLAAGSHLDLVGAFQPTTREADDAAVRRARIFVDTRAGAMHEAGDIALPLAAGVITAADIEGELSELCRGSVPGRRSADEITLFKSVGTALEDLAAAILVWRSLKR